MSVLLGYYKETVFDTPTTGDPFKALYYSEAVLAINGLGYSYATKSAGDDVIVERFNSLKNAINAKGNE